MDALILAGGRSFRMGRDKAQLTLGNQTLIERTISAVEAQLSPASLVVVGPHTLERDAPHDAVTIVAEQPPFAGPVAAIVQSFPYLRDEWVVILPCDLAEPVAAVELLHKKWNSTLRDSPIRRDAAAPHADALIARDANLHMQWLTAIVRTEALRDAARLLESTDVPVRALLNNLSYEICDAPETHPHIWQDMDTPQDFERARDNYTKNH